MRLYPLPAQEMSAGAIYEDLELPPPGRRDPSRPYVIINMVSSVDGRTNLEGKSSRIGSAIDRQAMRTLRSKADAVMVGAGTVRAERLSLGLDEPSSEPQPLAVIVTESGNVPLGRNLISAEHQEVVVITPQDAPIDLHDSARVLRVPAGTSSGADLGEAIKLLKAEHAVDLLLVEGGPVLNHALISSSLADELFLTLAPKLIGETPYGSPSILNGPTRQTLDVHLLSVHLAADELFLRYNLHPKVETA